MVSNLFFCPVLPFTVTLARWKVFPIRSKKILILGWISGFIYWWGKTLTPVNNHQLRNWILLILCSECSLPRQACWKQRQKLLSPKLADASINYHFYFYCITKILCCVVNVSSDTIIIKQRLDFWLRPNFTWHFFLFVLFLQLSSLPG